MEDGQGQEQAGASLVMQLQLACLDIPVMARPKKTELKRGNPDFHASSFYVRKTVNHQFNTAIGEMMLKGHEYDRSEVLEALMKQWAACPHPIA